jgi:hypothetical protein
MTVIQVGAALDVSVNDTYTNMDSYNIAISDSEGKCTCRAKPNVHNPHEDPFESGQLLFW